MSRVQRLAFAAIAAIIALAAVIVLAGGDDEQAATSPTPTATASASPVPEEASPVDTAIATAEPEDSSPLLTAGQEQEIEFKQGDTVTFRVRSDTADEVHVHGYDVRRDVEPGKTVRISFKATITGIFEIELEQAGKALAQLKVEP